jgi:hypothetical protein
MWNWKFGNKPADENSGTDPNAAGSVNARAPAGAQDGNPNVAPGNMGANRGDRTQQP